MDSVRPHARVRLSGVVALVIVSLTGARAAQPADHRLDRGAPVVTRFEAHRPDTAIRTTPGRIPLQVFVFQRSPGWFQVALLGESWRDEPRVWIGDGPVWGIPRTGR